MSVTTNVLIEPAFQEAVRAAGLHDFDAVMRAQGEAPSSRHRHRETLPLEITVGGATKRFYLKRVFKVPPRHGLAPLLRFRPGWTQPMREWEVLGLLHQARIPAMRRVACGERRRAGIPISAFLLVEEVPMAHTLEDWLVPGFPQPAELTPTARHRLTYDLGRLVGRLHQAGFLWPDVQAKHVFAMPCAADADQHWEFCLIDVERMRSVGSSDGVSVDCRGTTPAKRDIRRLASSLSPLAIGVRDARRFAAGYVGEGRRARAPGDRGDPMAIERLARAFGAARPRLPDGFEHPRAIPWQRVGRMLVDRRLLSLLTAAGLDTFKSVFANRTGRSLTKPGLQGFRDRVCLDVTDGTGSMKRLFLKRYRRPPLAAQIRRMVESRPSRSSAWREGRFGKQLALLGVPTARSVAIGERMRGVWEDRSFTITEAIDGESLESLANGVSAKERRAPSWRDRREIIEQLALVARTLHAHRIFHRDLYLSHVFLARNSKGEPVIHLIDLARMIERPRRTWRWVIKDLASLNYSAPEGLVTRADRLRFLYHYDPASAEGRSRHRRAERIRRYDRAILARTRRIARRDARRADRLEAPRAS